MAVDWPLFLRIPQQNGCQKTGSLIQLMKQLRATFLLRYESTENPQLSSFGQGLLPVKPYTGNHASTTLPIAGSDRILVRFKSNSVRLFESKGPGVLLVSV